MTFQLISMRSCIFIELDFIGWSVVLFKCELFDNYKIGVNNNQFGLIEIKHRSLFF